MKKATSVPLELTTRVLRDEFDWDRVNAVYLFGQTADNSPSEWEKICEIPVDWFHHGYLLVSGAPEKNGYPGGENWRKSATRYMRVARDIQFLYPIGTETANTLSEALALVSMAKQQRWEGVVVCSTPFHQLRAFMTVVSVALREYPELAVWNFVGRTQCWQSHVVHSQGVLRNTRAGLIRNEEERILLYQQSPEWPIAAFHEVIDYLDRRDEAYCLPFD